MNKKIGALKAWQWAAIFGGVILAYYLYQKYQANQATNAANTGAADTSNAGTVTEGLPYATGGSYGGYGSDLASQLASDFIDPTTNQPYFQEFSNAMTQAASDQTSAETQIENQLQTLSSTVAGLQSVTPTVPTPPATAAPIIINVAPPPAATTSPSKSPPSGNTSSLPSLSNLPIAEQIQKVMSGAAQVSQLGTNARKIYMAGGISTQYPTAAAVAAKNNPKGAPVGAFM